MFSKIIRQPAKSCIADTSAISNSPAAFRRLSLAGEIAQREAAEEKLQSDAEMAATDAIERAEEIGRQAHG
ncbi:hypothetical protein E1N52_42955 [Paraburkholderia guartelaensis]|uniref:Uncharacterized protein n=1 Tax=Paraburkholderia guartelaensis TaxID=2546446 RepID=A0A4R5L1E7_9BURK|nr:hypothetical protein [Paraburkholderia guartelaensis]TDG01500.1 hypothetical protein E1N52_42955 [Paraburkholderia guartelaensis]